MASESKLRELNSFDKFTQENLINASLQIWFKRLTIDLEFDIKLTRKSLNIQHHEQSRLKSLNKLSLKH